MQTQNVSLRAGKRLLVEGLDWHVQPGQCWCIIGRNGAGKSTLLRTLAGLREPDDGSILLQSKALATWPLIELARQRAFLPQGRNDAFSYRVLETVLAARHPYQDMTYWETDGDYQAAYAALQAVDVSELAERDVRSLSGGERQRVAIAAILAQDTPFLLLDEPTNALDLAHQVSVMELLARLCRENGKSVIMVSHDLNLAHSIADHALLLMDGGRWVAGPVGDVMTSAALTQCLGHPIEIIRHQSRTLFLPTERAKGTQETRNPS